MTEKTKLITPRLPRGFEDRTPGDIAAVGQMIETIRQVYERYGFDPVETPLLEYTETLISSLMDTWVLVAVDTVGYERQRKIYILKSRGMPHAEEVRDFRVTSRGVQILPSSRSRKRSATARRRR